MTGKRSPSAWLRQRGLRRDGGLGISPKAYRGSIAIWIAACFVLVVVLGTLQFQWIGQVSDAQLEADYSLLRAPMRAAIDQFREKMGLLLWMFRAENDRDSSDRLQSYSSSYHSWHAVSAHGPAVKRILFYGIQSSGRKELSELLFNPPRARPVAWDEDLAPVRRGSDTFWGKPGRMGVRSWISTWMFHAGSMAIYRPILTHEPDEFDRTLRVSVKGFLIL